MVQVRRAADRETDGEAVNELQQTFLKAAAPAAMASQAATGVPASITIAQAILESGWGQSGLAKKANNFFGIKAAAHVAPDSYIQLPTEEIVLGKTVTEQAEFARYASMTDSFKAHGLLLMQAARYAPAMAVRAYPRAFANALQRCGYSTNPNYAGELMHIVNQLDLTQYDTQANTQPAAPAEEKA
jgi:flagellum-specific peptidoglycan hydrolase FlgJ